MVSSVRLFSILSISGKTNVRSAKRWSCSPSTATVTWIWNYRRIRSGWSTAWSRSFPSTMTNWNSICLIKTSLFLSPQLKWIFRLFGAGCPVCESHHSGRSEPVFRAVWAGIIFCTITATKVTNFCGQGVQPQRRKCSIWAAGVYNERGDDSADVVHRFRRNCAPRPVSLCMLAAAMVHGDRFR